MSALRGWAVIALVLFAAFVAVHWLVAVVAPKKGPELPGINLPEVTASTAT